MHLEKLIFRPATEADIPEIVKLLKLSLGESLMPKSEEYWRWKHVNNPFGPSPVLLAMDGNKLVGVRAFMRWEWRRGNQIKKAVRAVDTATHPDYQGEGIFKKLTLSLVEECKKEGVDIIFNTPNEKSEPGYLKIGWLEAGRFPIGVAIKKPLSVFFQAIIGSRRHKEFISSESFGLNIPASFAMNCDRNKYSTNCSLDYFKWRYEKIPFINYYSVSNQKAWVVFRLIKGRGGTELRVVDVFGKKIHLKQVLKNLFKFKEFDFMSIDGFNMNLLPSLIKLKSKIGPSVTVNELRKKNSEFVDFSRWTPTIGDLEVF